MHIGKAGEIAKELLIVSEQALKMPLLEFEARDSGSLSYKRMYHKEETAILLDENSVARLYKLTDELLKLSNLNSKFSMGYLMGRLEDILIEVIVQELDLDGATSQVLRLGTELESYNKEWLVFVPIDGIELKVNSLELGNVLILTMTKEQYNSIAERYGKSVLNATDKLVDAVNRSLLEEITFMENKVFALYKVIAEPDRSVERAIEETRKVIDLLRFGLPSYPTANVGYIGITGEAFRPSNKKILLIPTDFLSFRSSRFIPESPYELSLTSIQALEEAGVFRLSEVIRKVKQMEFEQVILRSIHWYSTALTQSDLENQLINLIISMETLFTPAKSDPISNYIAEGTAFMISDRPNDRKWFKKRVKDLYGLRSSFAHGERVSLTNIQVLELEGIIKKLLHEAIKIIGKFENQNGFINWIEDLKFGVVKK